MANYGRRQAQVDILIGGVDQAKKDLEVQRNKWVLLSEAVEDARKKMEASVNTVDYDKNKKALEEIERERKQLAKVMRDNERNIKMVEKYLEDVSGQTLRNLNEARRALNQLLLSVSPKNTEGLETVRGYIKQIGDEISRRKGTLMEFSDIMGDMGNVSDKSLSMVKQRLQDLISTTKLNSQELSGYREQLSKVMEEEQRRVGAKAGAVMGNLQGSSLKEIQDAIKATEELRAVQKVGSQEWEIYSEEIERAKKYLDDYNTLEKTVTMDDRMKNIATLSSAALSETKRFWQEQVNGAQQGSVELAEYQQKLSAVIAEEQKRKSDRAGAVMGNLQGSSVADIQDAIKATEELRNVQTRGSAEWANYNKQIEDAKAYLKSYDEAARKTSVEKQMQNIYTLSKSGLEEVKKYWQEQVNGAELGSQKLKDYEDQLVKVIEQEQWRSASSAKNILSQVQTGTFDRTIGETKDAIKQLDEFKKQLNVSDTAGIKEVDDAIKKLTDSLKNAERAGYSYQDALNQADELMKGNFKGSIEDLERMKKSLEEYKKSLDISDTKELERVSKALRAIDEASVRAGSGIENMNEFIKNLDKKSMNELKTAAAQLQAELNNTARDTKEFVEKSKQLKQVNAQIDTVTKSWKDQDGTVKGVVKTVTSYLAAYVGLDAVIGKLKEMASANLELSDQLADIRKTTGLSEESVAELSREIDKIDTRTATAELHSLAYEAGKLGISAKEDVLGFVKAGNQLIAALGEDLGGAEAVRQLMKINDLLGETGRLGVEHALLATGSAINELSQNSTASAGPITEIISRLGAVGSQAKLSMADLAALGSTADALSQSVEVSGTAISMFVTALQTNTHAIAQAVGVTDESLKNLMETGRTMDAVILVLRQLKEMGGLQETNPIMKQLGSDGNRLKTVIGALSENVDVLEKHVRISNDAFREAVSVTNEALVKEESAIGILKRMGNSIREAFVNSGFVEILKQVLVFLSELPQWLEKNRAALFVLNTLLIGGIFKALASVATYIKGPFIAAWAALVHQFKVAQRAMRMAGISTSGLTGALRTLFTVIKANPIGIIMTAISAAAAAFFTFRERVAESEKATADFDAEIEKEVMVLDALFGSLKRTNKEGEERSRIIGMINEKYSTYLGFKLSDKDGEEQLAAAQELVNSKLRERIALQMQEKMNAETSGEYGGIIRKALSGMSSAFSSSKGITEALEPEAMRIVRNVVRDNIDKPMIDILTQVRSSLEGRFGNEMDTFGRTAYDKILSDLKTFIQANKDYRREYASTMQYVNEELEKAREDEVANTKKMLEATGKEYAKLAEMKVDPEDLAKVKEKNDRELELLQDYVKLSEKVMGSLSEKEEEELDKRVKLAQKRMNELSPKRPNVWGEGLSLETAGVEKLAAKYKELDKERKTMNKDANYKDIYSGYFADRVEAMKWYLDEMNKIEAQLNKLGYDYKGNLLRDKGRGKTYSYGGSIKTAKEINEESTAALSALEAYFNREKGMIQEAYLKREITEEEMNARLMKKEEEHLRDRIQLRKKLLGRENTFDQTKYKQTDTVSGETIDYFEGKDLGKLSGFIKQMGERMTDGMLNQLTQDELKVQQAAMEHMKKIQKIILDNDFTEQVRKQYQDELEALQLFWAKDEDYTQEAAKKRIQAMTELAEESYRIDAKELEARMRAREEFNDWLAADVETGEITPYKEEEIQALLEMLRKYHDDLEEAENKARQRATKIANEGWEKEGLSDRYDKLKKESEDLTEMYRNMHSLGMVSDSMMSNRELEMYKLRLEAAQMYYGYILGTVPSIVEANNKMKEAHEELTKAQLEGDAEAISSAQERYNQTQVAFQDAIDKNIDATNAMQQINDAQNELQKQEQAIMEEKYQRLKGYTDAIVEFSGQMGEAAFGEVEDRKAAAKQLLRTTMQLTKNLIMEEVKKMVMKKTLAAQDLALTQSTEAAKVAAEGAGAMTGLAVEGAKTTAETASGIARGSAKAIGDLGPILGIPLIAVISAALSALMGLAMGKLNKAKEEVAAATGVSSSKGRVAAGMLTYASGDYPVLGNDGNVYNATYQKELKTGVYGGGAHFGIFSEKKPEMIVDGDTTQKLLFNYPHIYDAILTIANHGRLRTAAMPTFAEGNYPSMPAAASQASSGVQVPAAADPRMEQTLAGVSAALEALTARLDAGISATVDPYGKKGAVNQLKVSEGWMKRRGLTP